MLGRRHEFRADRLADALRDHLVDVGARFGVEVPPHDVFERRELLVRLLAEGTGAEGILSRPERGTSEQEGIPHHEEILSEDKLLELEIQRRSALLAKGVLDPFEPAPGEPVPAPTP